MQEENKLIPITNRIVDHIRWKMDVAPWLFVIFSIFAAIGCGYDNFSKYMEIHTQPNIPVLIYDGKGMGCEVLIIKNKYIMTDIEYGLPCSSQDLGKIDYIAKNADFSNYDMYFPFTLKGIGTSLFYATFLSFPIFCIWMCFSRNIITSIFLTIPVIVFMSMMVIFGAREIHLPQYANSSAILYKDNAYCGWNFILTMIFEDACDINIHYNVKQKYEEVKEL